mmetsp:Transcript_37893/g.80942  ORF Transcript_37893/g.80942 Transcript_37893/m.80942 type:complete len:256 (-) Transcript_37893:84-851(-)
MCRDSHREAEPVRHFGGEEGERGETQGLRGGLLHLPTGRAQRQVVPEPTSHILPGRRRRGQDQPTGRGQDPGGLPLRPRSHRQDLRGSEHRQRRGVLPPRRLHRTGVGQADSGHRQRREGTVRGGHEGDVRHHAAAAAGGEAGGEQAGDGADVRAAGRRRAGYARGEGHGGGAHQAHRVMNHEKGREGAGGHRPENALPGGDFGNYFRIAVRACGRGSCDHKPEKTTVPNKVTRAIHLERFLPTAIQVRQSTLST